MPRQKSSVVKKTYNVVEMSSKGRIVKKKIPHDSPILNKRCCRSSNISSAVEIEEGQTANSAFDTTHTGVTAYAQRKNTEVFEWQQLRSGLLQASYQHYWPLTDVCCLCNTQNVKILRCQDCGPGYFACEECCVKDHVHRPFHFVEIWEGHCFETADIKRILNKPKSQKCQCTATYVVNFDVINASGVLITTDVELCHCVSLFEQLVSLNLFPSTPLHPKLAFSFAFLEWYCALLLEGHLSAKAFITAVSEKNGQDRNFASMLYKVLSNECLEEYKHLKRELLCGVNNFRCPACPSNGAFISMDANFGLVHKKSGGCSYEPPKHPWPLFCVNKEVEDYLSLHSDSSKSNDQDTDCNNFQAGNKLRSKVKNNKLDTTGVFAAICKHEIGLTMLNMTEGERLAYPCLVLNKILSQYENPKILYDIACVFEKYLQKVSGGEEVLNSIQLAIPSFHAYGHQARCQVLYGPGRLDGFGLVDGEACERLWSYLRPFSKITKEMTPSHRQDLLTDAVVYYNTKKRTQMPITLKNKLERAEKLRECAKEEIEKLMQAYSISVTPTLINQWQHEEKENFSSQNASKTDSKITWEEKYVSLLTQFNSSYLLPDVEADDENIGAIFKHKDVLEKIEKLEKQRKISVRWKSTDEKYLAAQQSLQRKKTSSLKDKMVILARDRKFLCSLSKKYSDGQAIAIKVARQIKNATTKLRKFMMIYEEFIGNKIAQSEVYDPSSSFYNLQFSTTDIAPAIKKELLDCFLKQKRAEEEIDIIKEEMFTALSSFEQEILLLTSKYEHSTYNPERAFIYSYIKKKRSSLSVCWNIFSKYLNKMPVLSDNVFEDGKLDSLDGVNVDENSDSDTDSDMDEVLL